MPLFQTLSSISTGSKENHVEAPTEAEATALYETWAATQSPPLELFKIAEDSRGRRASGERYVFARRRLLVAAVASAPCEQRRRKARECIHRLQQAREA